MFCSFRNLRYPETIDFNFKDFNLKIEEYNIGNMSFLTYYIYPKSDINNKVSEILCAIDKYNAKRKSGLPINYSYEYCPENKIIVNSDKKGIRKVRKIIYEKFFREL